MLVISICNLAIRDSQKFDDDREIIIDHIGNGVPEALGIFWFEHLYKLIVQY